MTLPAGTRSLYACATSPRARPACWSFSSARRWVSPESAGTATVGMGVAVGVGVIVGDGEAVAVLVGGGVAVGAGVAVAGAGTMPSSTAWLAMVAPTAIRAKKAST